MKRRREENRIKTRDMEITGKAHCLFEQSGTFKREFIKLGIPAEDYDIQNNFGETDHVIDLFAEIERGYAGEPSIFDSVTPDDIIMAFFPCIYFCENNQLYFTGKHHNLQNLTPAEIEELVMQRGENRHYLWTLLLKLFHVCTVKSLRMIVENPYSPQHYLHLNFPYKPSVIDRDRTRRGDFFTKPTQFFFHNCEPTQGMTYTTAKEKKIVNKQKMGIKAGICSEDRSMISPDYARNFICDFILGKLQVHSQMNLFEQLN